MKYGLGFLSQKEKSQLIDIINQSMITWCEEWINSNIISVVQIEKYSKVHHDLSDFDFYGLNSQPIIGFLKNDMDTWINVLFRNMKGFIPKDEVTLHLIENAKKDLLAKIYNNSDLDDCHNNWTQMSNIDFDGIPIIAYIQLGEEELKLLLDSHLLNSKDDIDLVNTPVSIHSLHDEVVVIQTKFALDKLLVSDFLGIQVGDVIKSNHYITQPFSISCKGHEIALASLGQAENHRAILLTSNHEIKK